MVMVWFVIFACRPTIPGPCPRVVDFKSTTLKSRSTPVNLKSTVVKLKKTVVEFKSRIVEFRNTIDDLNSLSVALPSAVVARGCKSSGCNQKRSIC